MNESSISRNQHVAKAWRRLRRVVDQRPAAGQGTQSVTARIRKGLVCDVEAGEGGTFTSDANKDEGGESAAPSPGAYCLASLACCLAMGYVMRAAEREIPISDMEVSVYGDFDLRGELGLADVPKGYSSIRYVVKVGSPAPHEDVMQIIEESDEYSSILDVFRRPCELERKVKITETAG